MSRHTGKSILQYVVPRLAAHVVTLESLLSDETSDGSNLRAGLTTLLWAQRPGEMPTLADLAGEHPRQYIAYLRTRRLRYCPGARRQKLCGYGSCACCRGAPGARTLRPRRAGTPGGDACIQI